MKKTTEKVKNVVKKAVELKQDTFGSYVDKTGNKHVIQRFTWKNQNKIEVQVITFGARVTTVKLPNRKGIIEDIALGFDNLAGYIYYDDLYMGSTIGRTANYIENGTFKLDSQQYWLTVNKGNHHYNGGFIGFDKTVWTPNVNGTKLTLSHVFEDTNEGYPGDLFTRITFELSCTNEFLIDMEAFTTKPTIVSLSHLLYFNLGGHGSGFEEINKHIVNINANCHLPMQAKENLPTGDIQNVIYTENNFQIPVILKNVLQNPDSKCDVHLCINRGIDQGNCFMARAIHPPSGRILELYSNQYGLHFYLNNDFSDATVPLEQPQLQCTKRDSVFSFIDQMHAHVLDLMKIDRETDYSELNKLIQDLYKKKVVIERENDDNLSLHIETEYCFSPMQIKYLEAVQVAADDLSNIPEYKSLAILVKTILNAAIVKSNHEVQQEAESIENNETKIQEEEALEKLEKQVFKEKKGKNKPENKIPECYKDGRIHGKNNAIYKKQGAICFQSENYPNAIYHPNFPKTELRPGETYRHTIIYKFWLQDGSYHRWIKRNCKPNPGS